MCIDDIKLFAENKNLLEILIQTMRMYNQDSRMEYGIEKMPCWL